MKISDFKDFFPDKKRSKYGNIRTLYNGIWYQSKAEADYAADLDLLKAAHDPKLRPLSIERQVKYPITVEGVHVCDYYADFRVVYNNRTEVIDVKGKATDVYKLKKKLVEALHQITIKEIKREKW